jgi:hypothetical protein
MVEVPQGLILTQDHKVLSSNHSSGPMFLDVVEVPQGLILPVTLISSSRGRWCNKEMLQR